MSYPHKLTATCLAIICIAMLGLSHAHGNAQLLIPASMQVNEQTLPATSGISDLKFRDFFKMPIGPRGTEMSEKLLSLNGKHVRILGYMANAESPSPGVFLLSPLPVELGDEDESLSDDIPPSTVFVHMDAESLVVPHMPGLIKITGILSVGNHDEADGHVSTVRLFLDHEITADIANSLQNKHASQ